MIDVVTLEVFNNRLKAIAEEMQFTLERSAHSPSIREGADCSAGIFDRDGKLVSQATALPVHLGSLGPAIEGMLKAFPAAAMKEGDVYIMNDPYAGGQHFPDIIMLVPVVHEGRVIALVCNLGHHQDIGGAAPGGNATNTTEIYQEGLRLPPLKLYDAGVLNGAVEAILRANVRIPDIVWGDLVAQTAAASVGRQRMRALWLEMGGEKFDEAVRSLQDVAERMSRQVIERIPDGEYSFEDYLDNDGIELDRRVRIQARVTVAGSNVHVDFTGTDLQVRGPFNAVPSVTLSAVRYVVRCITGGDVPNNEGAYRVVSIHVPEGTLLNPRAPASISCRAVTARRVVDCVMGAFAQVLPGVVPAASHGHSFSQRIGGIDPETGAMWVTSITGAGGMGARPAKDGVEAIQTDTSNARNFHLLAFGGAGPVHAPALAADLEIPAVLVPACPGVLAAFGLLTANVEHDQKLTCMQAAVAVDPAKLEATYRELERACLERMARDAISPERCEVRRLADLRYRGQSAEIEVPVAARLDGAAVRAMITEFHARHQRAFSYVNADSRVEFVNAKVVASCAMPKPKLDVPDGSGAATGKPYTTRKAYFASGAVSAAIYRRADLRRRERYAGPAIVEQADTTLVVPPGQAFDVDESGNIVVRTGKGAREAQ